VTTASLVHSAQPIFVLLRRLWRHISARRRTQMSALMILMLFASVAEIFSIGAVLPFLGVLTSPGVIFDHPMAQPFIRILGLASPSELLLPLTVAFAVAVLLAGLMRMLLIWASTRLSFATGSDISISMYQRTLYQPYAVHLSRNSSQVINGIAIKANNVIYNVVVPILTLVSAAIMLLFILIAMLAVDPFIALSASAGFGLIYACIILLTRKQLMIDSQRVARESTNVIKSLQEGLGGVRDVLIDGSQAAHCEVYRNADLPLRRAQGNTFFVSQFPRVGMEALGMLLIAGLAYVLAQEPGGVAKAIPVLGALALGAQRLLPVVQQAYAAWSSVQAGQVSFQDTLDLLDQPLPDYVDHPPARPQPFVRNISLRDVSFRYHHDGPQVLDKVNLVIAKGSRVGFIGTTGSGKSTMLDIIMGLLQPTSGSLQIDGESITPANHRAWQAHIAHVPQAIFLSDSTIEENIAFGVPKAQIDHQRVRMAAQRAQLSSIIETWPKQYDTVVGERGVRLSGGQRQRIGIARALYKQANVMIFDEATSALDNETEKAVMQAIGSLSEDITILIIAHRVTTLKNCTQIVELDHGRITRTGSYQDIVAPSV
jgi:ABC-type bacteriocin/lantibiotic exporter with double-glycine peptidase domain